MSRRETDSPNWGGRRKNAGRPKEIGESSVKVTVRLDPDTVAECKELGGATFIRNTLKEALSRMKAGLWDKPAENAAAAKVPGFESVSRSFFARPTPGERDAYPFTDMQAACGFPNPASLDSAEEVSLSELLIKHPNSTFLMETTGDSMVDAGIYEGDTIILDSSLEPRSGDIVLAYLHGDITLKRLRIVDGRPELHPENAIADYPVIRPTKYDDFQIQGVLTGICRRLR